MTKYRARRTARVGHEYLIQHGDEFTKDQLADHLLEILLSQNLIEEKEEDIPSDPEEMTYVTTFEERQRAMAEGLDITDAARELAIDEGVVERCLKMDGSGKDGRILKSDVEGVLNGKR